MKILRIATLVFLALLLPAESAPQLPATEAPVVATASITGIVVRAGTNEPIIGADVELSRVAGTEKAPIAENAAAFFRTVLDGPGPGTAAPPAAIAAEVQYAQTDSNGRFEFRDLKEGKYRLVSARIGGAYYPAEFGQHDIRERGLNFPVGEGESLRDLRLEMQPTSAITGLVLDENGQPMAHVAVFALLATYRNGQRLLNIDQSVYTNDRGEYRLFWLGPGQYYVAAAVEDPRRRTMRQDPFPPGRRGPTARGTSPYVMRRTLPGGEAIEETYTVVYNGGALDYSQALPIDLPAGRVFGGVNIPMGSGKMQARHIRGVVIDGATGQPASGATIRAIPLRWSPNALILNGTADEAGAFDLAGAVPGGYVLFTTTRAQPAGLTAAALLELVAAAGPAAGALVDALAGQPTGIGYLPIEVSGADLNDIRIVTVPGFATPGRVAIDGRAPDADELTRMRVQLLREPEIIGMPGSLGPLPPLPPGTPAASRPQNGQPDINGAFTLHMLPGDFRVNIAGAPADTYIKSIRQGGVDILGNGLRLLRSPENPLEVVLGVDGGEITGSVIDASRQPALNAVVALAPDSPALRNRRDLYRSAMTDAAGRFKLENIAPGAYRLFSWEYVPDTAWMNPAFMQPYEALGSAVRILENGRENVQLTILPIRR